MRGADATPWGAMSPTSRVSWFPEATAASLRAGALEPDPEGRHRQTASVAEEGGGEQRDGGPLGREGEVERAGQRHALDAPVELAAKIGEADERARVQEEHEEEAEGKRLGEGAPDDGEKVADSPISTCRACALKRQARERCERTLVGGNRSTNEAAGWPRSSWSWLSPKCGVAVWPRARAASMA